MTNNFIKLAFCKETNYSLNDYENSDAIREKKLEYYLNLAAFTVIGIPPVLAETFNIAYMEGPMFWLVGLCIIPFVTLIYAGFIASFCEGLLIWGVEKLPFFKHHDAKKAHYKNFLVDQFSILDFQRDFLNSLTYLKQLYHANNPAISETTLNYQFNFIEMFKEHFALEENEKAVELFISVYPSIEKFSAEISKKEKLSDYEKKLGNFSKNYHSETEFEKLL